MSSFASRQRTLGTAGRRARLRGARLRGARLAVFVAVLGYGALATACARPRPIAAYDPETSTTDTTVVLEIENHNWSDVNVFILHDGRRHRLTTVTATKDKSIPIPSSFQGETGTFRLAVYRIGGRDVFVSEPVSVKTGFTVRLTVESDLARSSVGVW